MKINTDKGKNVYFKCNYDIFLQKNYSKLLKIHKCQKSLCKIGVFS